MISPAGQRRGSAGGLAGHPGAPAAAGRPPRFRRGTCQTLHSGAAKRRDPGSSRYAGKRGISKGPGRAEIPECVAMRTNKGSGRPYARHCMIWSAASGGAAGGRGLGGCRGGGHPLWTGPDPTLGNAATARSRKLPLCGQTRDLVVLAHVISAFLPLQAAMGRAPPTSAERVSSRSQNLPAPSASSP
jgi:hypothetical protein